MSDFFRTPEPQMRGDSTRALPLRLASQQDDLIPPYDLVITYLQGNMSDEQWQYLLMNMPDIKQPGLKKRFYSQLREMWTKDELPDNRIQEYWNILLEHQMAAVGGKRRKFKKSRKTKTKINRTKINRTKINRTKINRTKINRTKNK